MRSKGLSLPSQRTRAGRVMRRVAIAAIVLISGLLLLLIYMITTNLGDSDAAPETYTPRNQRTANPSGGGNNGGGGGAHVTDAAEDTAPYSENLEELLELLRVYASARGIYVNTSSIPSLSTATKDRAGQPDRVVDELLLAGIELLRTASGAGGAATATAAGIGLQTRWVLDDPSTIKTMQEDYVERYISPAQPDIELTPLRVITEYYDPNSPHSLHRMAAATEKSMNDDGYATYIQRSPTFFDPAHAARRGYGHEGSIFVAIPFTLQDITPDMINAIAARAAAGTPNGSVRSTIPPAQHNPLDGADDAASAADVDGFREVHRTAAHCAMTVESVLRNAHRAIGVTVGTLDVVVATGVQSDGEVMDINSAREVRFPVTAEERMKLADTRSRRYDRITCEPPNFRSGWADASYGFSWKDNARQRRVLVPLTKLTASRAEQRSSWTGTLLPLLGRYAVLQLYRGESYVFLLRPGSVALPNWDLKLRLLYLHTPQRERAVLSSRPTPAVAWQAMTLAILHTFSTSPDLAFASSPSASVEPTSPQNTQVPVTATLAAPQSELSWMAKKLLSTLPDSVAAWLTDARADPALVLWLVTPRWLWPTVTSALQELRTIPTNETRVAGAAAETPTHTNNDRLRPSFSDLFPRAVLASVLASGNVGAAAQLNVSAMDVEVDDGGIVKVRGGGNGGGGGGPSNSTARTGQRFVAESLTESEVYHLLFLTEKRPPMPNEPITDMAKLLPPNTSTPAQGEVATSVDAVMNLNGLLCGSTGTPMAYYSAKEAALVKRAMEYCWLYRHRATLRALIQQLTDSTDAMTLLTRPTDAVHAEQQTSTTKTPAAAAAVKCGNDESSLKWYDTTVRTGNTSQCLRDMRYLDPEEVELPIHHVPAAADAAAAAEKSKTAAAVTPTDREAWLVSAANAGQLQGSSVLPPRRSKTVSSTTATPSTSTTTTAAAGYKAATPFVLQSVASADLLFAPAEAFFDFLPEDRLRTRARTLPEQLAKKQHDEQRRAAGDTTASLLSTHTETPESVVLDPSLQYMDAGVADLYLTTALWTRGWNIFGVTEAVAGGDEAPEEAQTRVKKDPSVCEVKTDAGSSTPAAIKAAQAFTKRRFWEMLTAHRAAGSPVGPFISPKNATEGSAKTLFPLRRTLQAYEAFAGLKLHDLRKTDEEK